VHADRSLPVVSRPLGAPAFVGKKQLRRSALHGMSFLEAVKYVAIFGIEHRVLGQIYAIGVEEIQYAVRLNSPLSLTW
jgi:hypothetical protein